MKRILFCVLNWGLGHATRSIPLIEQCLDHGVDLRIASDGEAAAYLQRRFPTCQIYPLPGYEIQYNGSLWTNAIRIASQMNHAIKAEQRSIKLIVEDFSPNMIISDNRYGCYHESAFNVMMTHQLKILVSPQPAQQISQALIRQKVSKFDEIWIPDYPPPHNLSGEMSDVSYPNKKFIGPLSQLENGETKIQENKLLLLISGPETTRTAFENKLLDLPLSKHYSCELIRGTDKILAVSTEGCQVINIATAGEVQAALLTSKYVICRSGYSTVMDLQKMGKTAVFVPTTGQPEQIYLAKRMEKLGLGVAIEEKNISMHAVQNAFAKIDSLPPLAARFSDTESNMIEELLSPKNAK